MNPLPSLNSEFNRLSLRLTHIFHMDSMLTGDRLPDAVRQVFKSDFGEIEEALNRKCALGNERSRARNPLHLEQMILARIEEEPEAFGWLVKASQPEFRVEDNGELHFPWQPVRTAWFYAPTYETAIDLACSWAAQYYSEAWGEHDQD